MRKAFKDMEIGQEFTYYAVTGGGVYGFNAEKLDENTAVVFDMDSANPETIEEVIGDCKYDLLPSNDKDWENEISQQDRMMGDF